MQYYHFKNASRQHNWYDRRHTLTNLFKYRRKSLLHLIHTDPPCQSRLMQWHAFICHNSADRLSPINRTTLCCKFLLPIMQNSLTNFVMAASAIIMEVYARPRLWLKLPIEKSASNLISQSIHAKKENLWKYRKINTFQRFYIVNHRGCRSGVRIPVSLLWTA